MNTKLSLEAINNALTAFDPMWVVVYVPWGDSVICHMTVNGITRSHVGNVGATEIERYEDAFRNAARMFGVGGSVARCDGGGLSSLGGQATMKEPIWSDVRIMRQAIDYAGYISSVVTALTEMRDEYETALTALKTSVTENTRLANVLADNLLIARLLSDVGIEHSGYGNQAPRVTWCDVCGMPTEHCRENY